MRRRALVSVIFTAFAFILAAAGFSSADEARCAFCGMNIAGNENTVYEITTTDGKTEIYESAHCGLLIHARDRARVKSARARDFISGEWTDPSNMFFVFNSTAVPACAPSWIAFGRKIEAEKFQRGFGGKVFSFEEALKERLKHPRGMEMKKEGNL